MNEKDSIKDLISQAKNTKQLVDQVSAAYLGMTTEEILRLALGGRNEKEDDDGG